MAPTRSSSAGSRRSSSTSACRCSVSARLVAQDPESPSTRGERPGWDEELWKQMVELGWTGLAVPEPPAAAACPWPASPGWSRRSGAHACRRRSFATLCATYAAPRGRRRREAVAPADRAGGPRRRSRSRRARRLGAFRAAASTRGRTAPAAACSVDWACFVQDAFKADLLVVSARARAEVVLCVVPRRRPGLRSSRTTRRPDARPAAAHFAGVAVPADAIVARDAERRPSRTRAGPRSSRRSPPISAGRRVASPDDGRVREDEEAVRPLDRLIPGGEASARERHDRDRPRALAALPRGGGVDTTPGRARRRAHGEERSDPTPRALRLRPVRAAPRRYRLHVGVRRAPLLQAQPPQPGALRRRRPPPAPPGRRPDRPDRGSAS